MAATSVRSRTVRGRMQCRNSLRGVETSRRCPAPQLRACQPRALHQSLELGPGHGWTDRHHARESAEAAIGAGNDPFAADNLRETQDAVAHQLRMLHVLVRNVS